MLVARRFAPAQPSDSNNHVAAVSASVRKAIPRQVGIVIGVLGFIVVALQLGLTAFMAGRVMPGVAVAGVEIGGMTRAQASKALTAPLQNYKINLAVGSASYSLSPADVGAVHDINTTLDQAFIAGRNQWFAPLQLVHSLNSQPLSYAYRLDNTTHEAFLEKVVSASGKKPVDAGISFKDGVPIVEPDADGHSLSKKALSDAVAVSLATFSPSPVKLQPITQHARIRASHAVPAVAQTKELLAVPVTITYENKQFHPTLAQKSDWITYQKSPEGQAPALIPTINKDGIKNYLQSLAIQINVNPTNRKINVQNGSSQETQAGQDGLQLDQESLAVIVASGFEAKKPLVAVAPTTKVPFKTEYNHSVSLDYGQYVEINLSLQRLWVYEDHKVIYESPITSGAVASGYPTVTGLFSVQAKQTNRNLNGYAIGYNYNVFVKYWIPFHGNYGLHDASWRNGVFGGQDYKYNGSHGCVNLPEATAAFLFGWASVGTPVWVHN